MAEQAVFPHPDGVQIAALTAGQEIVITDGYGNPVSDENHTEIVVEVSGFSAITNEGTRLMCSDGSGIQPTGIVHEEF